MSSPLNELGVEQRAEIAGLPSMRPEILTHLARDRAASVRRAVAANPSAPSAANQILAQDADDSVRSDLAGKLARLTPTLSPTEHRELYQATLAVLDVLGRDRLTAVRRMVAEALRAQPGIPPTLVMRLARDPEPTVCAPVLQFSPVLTDQDLMEIIASAPVQGALAAISRRVGVSEQVSDAIVQSADAAAIADLLSNKSAQIREATLDMIIETAPNQPSWHAPLVRRPQLPQGAALRIGRFVAEGLLRDLAGRGDLDERTRAELAAIVDRRLVSEANGRPQPRVNADDASARAQRLHRVGALVDELFEEAIRNGDRPFLAAALANRAGVDVELVTRAFERRGARAVVALSIRAGLPPRMAVDLQSRIARVPPGAILAPVGDRWRMTEDEISLEFDLLRR